MRYPVVVHKEADADFGVTVPDLPGCFSAGATLDEALEMARQAIECHLEGLLLDDDPVPAVQPLGAHRENPDYAGGLWALVEVDFSKLGAEVERINVSLPARVLALVDRYAKAHGETRSGFLARAAIEVMRQDAA